jgi:hypothetical protein
MTVDVTTPRSEEGTAATENGARANHGATEQTENAFREERA